MPSSPVTILSDATSSFKNGLRRMKSGPLKRHSHAKGKENHTVKPFAALSVRGLPNIIVTSASNLHVMADNRWAPKDGTIDLKVSVPATDDIWRFRVSQDITLHAFQAKVALKLGFSVFFIESHTGRNRNIASEDAFKRWVVGRVKNGRNHPITAHRVP